MTGGTVITAMLAVGTLFGTCACDPFHTEFDDIERAETYRARELSSPSAEPDDLSVMTYNIKFAGGRIDFFFDCHGDRVLMRRNEVVAHLDALAQHIRAVDPDVLLLQEVDVNSKRSAFVDQLQWLLDHTELNHAVYASQWRADFVPSDGIGAVDSGNAIVSKYPLRHAERIALPLRTDQSGIERYFFLRRNVLRAELDLARSEPVFVVATHTAAFSNDGTKLRHIERFLDELESLRAEGVVVGGGDLNALPPGSLKTNGFEDSACTDEFEADDYSEEADWLEPLYDAFQAAVSLDEYTEDNAAHFTHTTEGDGFWNRKLDYLFSNRAFLNGSTKTHQTGGETEAMMRSDHAAVSSVLRLDEPE